MGGGQELFDQNQQYDIASKELGRVYFTVFPVGGNEVLFDEDKIYITFSKKIAAYFKDNGILYEDVGPVGGGGGGEETLLEALKLLWANKDVIIFFASVIALIKSTYIKWINNNVKNLKPKVFLSFWIASDSDLNKIKRDDLNFLFSNRMANLLLIANSICSSLQTDHEFICCDFSVEGKLKSKDYSLQISITHDDRRTSNIDRFLRVIKGVKIRKNLSSQYNLTKWFAIHRTDNRITYSRDSSISEHTRNYYLFFSTRILRDYFN